MQHVAEQGLSYGTIEEFNFRRTLFEHVDFKIKTFNSDPSRTSTLAHNQFSTWTETEKKRLMGFRMAEQVAEPKVLEETNAASVNWVTAGKVSPIQNQGQCGSCWAFATTAAVETSYAVKNNSLLKLSEQQLVSCNSENYGCSGGWMEKAYAYLQSHWFNQLAYYPYTSGTTSQTGSC